MQQFPSQSTVLRDGVETIGGECLRDERRGVYNPPPPHFFIPDGPRRGGGVREAEIFAGSHDSRGNKKRENLRDH